MKRLRSKLTYSNVMVTILAMVVLGSGTAFAASQLERESVGTNALKKEAVTPLKLSKKAKATLTGPAGQTGATGPEGPRGERGVRGEKGASGEPGPFPGTLPAGKTIYGEFEMLGTATTAGQLFGNAISYTYRLPGQGAIYVLEGKTSPSCTGSYANPTAPPGLTCIYEASSTNAESTRGVNYASTEAGVGLQAPSAAAGIVQVYGSWAATAG